MELRGLCFIEDLHWLKSCGLNSSSSRAFWRHFLWLTWWWSQPVYTRWNQHLAWSPSATHSRTRVIRKGTIQSRTQFEEDSQMFLFLTMETPQTFNFKQRICHFVAHFAGRSETNLGPCCRPADSAVFKARSDLIDSHRKSMTFYFIAWEWCLKIKCWQCVFCSCDFCVTACLWWRIPASQRVFVSVLVFCFTCAECIKEIKETITGRTHRGLIWNRGTICFRSEQYSHTALGTFLPESVFQGLALDTERSEVQPDKVTPHWPIHQETNRNPSSSLTVCHTLVPLQQSRRMCSSSIRQKLNATILHQILSIGKVEHPKQPRQAERFYTFASGAVCFLVVSWSRCGSAGQAPWMHRSLWTVVHEK